METPLQQPQQGGISVDPNTFLTGTTSIHTHLNQEILVITADKLELALAEHQKWVRIKTDWITPASIFLSSLAAIVAADFKNYAFINAETWESMFLLICIVSFIWTSITCIRAFKYRNKGNYSELVKELKKEKVIR
ncbi:MULTISPECIES: hypothetical protein [Paenibacillus]|uniref:hypothetical protein n=2 Tax=Bacillati TaxID=1783272 RepID=UPI0011A7F25D|nr:hypothetical protein [Paenibacillus sp. IHBB 10380]